MILTQRQLECVMHLANGKTMEEIAEALFLSVRSVKYTLKSARDRPAIRANNNAHLVAIVIAKGLLVWDEDDNTHSMDNEKGPPQKDDPNSLNLTNSAFGI